MVATWIRETEDKGKEGELSGGGGGHGSENTEVVLCGSES